MGIINRTFKFTVGGLTGAALGGQVVDQRLHQRQVGAVALVTAFGRDAQQTGLRQRLEMERQIGRRHAQGAGDLAGHQAVRTLAHQQTVDVQPYARGERLEHFDGLILFHVSIIHEILNQCKSC